MIEDAADGCSDGYMPLGPIEEHRWRMHAEAGLATERLLNLAYDELFSNDKDKRGAALLKAVQVKLPKNSADVNKGSLCSCFNDMDFKVFMCGRVVPVPTDCKFTESKRFYVAASGRLVYNFFVVPDANTQAPSCAVGLGWIVSIPRCFFPDFRRPPY